MGILTCIGIREEKIKEKKNITKIEKGFKKMGKYNFIQKQICNS